MSVDGVPVLDLAASPRPPCVECGPSTAEGQGGPADLEPYGGMQDGYVAEIERLQQVVATKDAAHAKDSEIFEEMVQSKMLRIAELEATVESLRGTQRLELQRMRRRSESSGHGLSGGGAASPRKEMGGTGEAPREDGKGLELRLQQLQEETHVPLQNKSTAGTGDSPELRGQEEDLAEITARQNAELLKLVAEMRQREQALREVQAQTDASHVIEISELQEQLATLTSRCCAELQEALAAQQSVAVEQSSENNFLKASNAQLTQLAETRAQHVKDLEGALAMRDVIMSNQVSRIELREQEHRLQLVKLQAAIEKLGKLEGAEFEASLAVVEDLVNAMKRSERDYHFQRAAADAAVAAARPLGDGERLRRVELDASKAVLEAAARKMKERSMELVQLGEGAEAKHDVARSRSEAPSRSAQNAVVRSRSEGRRLCRESSHWHGPTGVVTLDTGPLVAVAAGEGPASGPPSAAPSGSCSPTASRRLVAVVGSAEGHNGAVTERALVPLAESTSHGGALSGNGSILHVPRRGRATIASLSAEGNHLDGSVCWSGCSSPAATAHVQNLTVVRKNMSFTGVRASSPGPFRSGCKSLAGSIGGLSISSRAGRSPAPQAAQPESVQPARRQFQPLGSAPASPPAAPVDTPALYGLLGSHEGFPHTQAAQKPPGLARESTSELAAPEGGGAADRAGERRGPCSPVVRARPPMTKSPTATPVSIVQMQPLRSRAGSAVIPSAMTKSVLANIPPSSPQTVVRMPTGLFTSSAPAPSPRSPVGSIVLSSIPQQAPAACRR
mmetsp:Transcript_5074/g.11905  ORF Transcript_5074/g.11905 Transcript_5074/m.11905 type:complete len:789 (-) Transcript_5074:44-2410(-)